MLVFFHMLVLQEYWLLTEIRIPLKLVVKYLRIVALFISSHEQTKKTSMLFSNIIGSLFFLKDPFFQIVLLYAGSAALFFAFRIE